MTLLDDRVLCKRDCSRLIQSTGVCGAAAAGLMPGFARTYQPPDRPLRCWWFLGHHQGLLLNADTGAARWPLLAPGELQREREKQEAREAAAKVVAKDKRRAKK